MFQGQQCKWYLRGWKKHQSLSLRHRRKFRVEKGEEQKTALLLIHDQEKVNMAKNKTSKMCIHWEREVCYCGRKGRSRPRQNQLPGDALSHSPILLSLLRLSTFIAQKQCLKPKKSEHSLQQRFHLLQEQNCFRLRGSNYRLLFLSWVPTNPKGKNIHH